MESGASGELLRRGTGDRGTRDSEVRDFASRRVTSELCLVREVRCDCVEGRSCRLNKKEIAQDKKGN